MKFQVSISHQKVVDNKKLDLDKSKYKTKSRCTRYIIIFFRTIDCEHTLSQGMLLSLKDRLQVCNSKIREAQQNQIRLLLDFIKKILRMHTKYIVSIRSVCSIIFLYCHPVPFLSLILSSAVFSIMAISEEVRRSSPRKWQLLSIFTIGEAIAIGFIGSLYSSRT